MKKTILILITAALFSCSDDDSVNPSTSQTQTTQQQIDYTGTWETISNRCINDSYRIEKGSSPNELIFDGKKGVLNGSNLKVNSPFGNWDINFTSNTSAEFDYNGVCTGFLFKQV